MRVTILHNPEAGSEDHSKDYIVGLVRAAGYDVTYRLIQEDFTSVLKDADEFVVVAGGDGAIRKVALKLIGREVPIAIMPMGTANNISKSLGVAGAPEEVVAGWRFARRHKLLVGIAAGSSRQEFFVEAAGLGLFSHSMTVLEAVDEQAETDFSEPSQKLQRDVSALKAWLADLAPIDLRCEVDGKDVSGSYLLMEAMNIECVGPNLCLAPRDSERDFLEFVFLEASNRDRFDRYLADLLAGTVSHPPVDVIRGKRIELQWDGSPLHVDDTIWNADRPGSEAVEIRLTSHALEFLVPDKHPSRHHFDRTTQPQFPHCR